MSSVFLFWQLFDTTGFPPRWFCGTGWSDFLGWFYIGSNLLVWSAYFAIPVIILFYLFKKKEIKFHTGYFMFAAFILSCGSTHLIDALIFWVPVYRFNALMLFFTGLVSWVTVAYLVKNAPVALTMKTASELEVEVESRKKVEEELQNKIHQMDEAQSIAKIGSWEWDLEADRIFWSKEMFRIFGIDSKGDHVSFKKDVLPYVPEEDREYLMKVINQCVENKLFTDFFHRIKTSEGKIKVMLVKGEVTLNNEGNVIGLRGTAQDVSEQKNAEQELLSKTMKLEEVNKGLEKFAYIASHDLQEPMRKIKTYLSLLGQGEGFLKDARNTKHIEKINLAATRMQQLMDDILLFSRVTSEEVSIAPVSLEELVLEVLGDLEVTIKESEAEVKVGSMPQIEGNATQLRQLFQNLISNALKFRKPGMLAKVEVSGGVVQGSELKESEMLKVNYKFKDWDKNYHWQKEEFCKIQVRDNGIGFDLEYRERIFEAFKRLHNLSTYEGTGIGLAICKKIVEMHNGSISASSTSQGSIFSVIIPLSQANFRRSPINLN